MGGKRDPAAHETYLYRIFDSAGSLVYVGVTVNPDARMRNHRRRNWWPDNAAISWEGPYSRSGALIREKDAIRSEGPKANGLRMTGAGERRRLATYSECLNRLQRPPDRFELERLKELQAAVWRIENAA